MAKYKNSVNPISFFNKKMIFDIIAQYSLRSKKHRKGVVSSSANF